MSIPSVEELAPLCFECGPREWSKNKTIIFDLDETLIINYSRLSGGEAGCVVPPGLCSGGNGSTEQNTQSLIGIRPYAVDVVRELSKIYEVWIFTASCKEYADPIINLLDPLHQYVSRVFYREHCVQLNNGIFVKDLRIFKDRDLKQTVLIDNSVLSFSFQLDNGVFISSYYGQNNDSELLYIFNYLKDLYYYDNVQDRNRKSFGFSSFLNSLN
jgi:CTD small phosphatase-like protein 2